MRSAAPFPTAILSPLFWRRGNFLRAILAANISVTKQPGPKYTTPEMNLRKLLSHCILLASIIAPATLFAQLHFGSPASVDSSDYTTGTAEVDSQISQFWQANPGYSLSYNVLWTESGTAILDGGTHSVSHTATITIGLSAGLGPSIERTREHNFSFELELVRNADGDYYVRIKWQVTDPGATGSLIAKGVHSIARVLKTQPGVIQKPQRTLPDATTVDFALPPPTLSLAGRWETVTLPAQRCYWRESDGALVVEAYNVRLRIFVPDQNGESGGDNQIER